MTATETEAVTYELRGPVAWLTINRPEARNALSAAATRDFTVPIGMPTRLAISLELKPSK